MGYNTASSVERWVCGSGPGGHACTDRGRVCRLEHRPMARRGRGGCGRWSWRPVRGWEGVVKGPRRLRRTKRRRRRPRGHDTAFCFEPRPQPHTRQPTTPPPAHRNGGARPHRAAVPKELACMLRGFARKLPHNPPRLRHDLRARTEGGFTTSSPPPDCQQPARITDIFRSFTHPEPIRVHLTIRRPLIFRPVGQLQPREHADCASS